MQTAFTPAPTFADTKKHYEVLDGLRGVAALVVIVFHILETFTGGNHLKQIINHGYLAVDFFFLLSGYVIGYAYDDRWRTMTLGSFFKRRLIRLHPMIVMGMMIGAILFYFGASDVVAPNIAQTPVWKMLMVMVIGFTLLPLPLSMDIRGWQEMHPLNGPAWSLFFEYIANILYALVVRKFPNWALSLLVALSGAALLHWAVTGPHGDMIGGWSLTPEQLRVGFTRLMYPFFAGLLLSRVVKPGKVKNAFLWCSILVVTALAVPRLGGSERLWLNGLYDALTIIFVFPLIVYLGASGKPESTLGEKVSRFLGDISYPVYIIHYPLIYIFTAWVVDNKISMQASVPAAVLLFFGSIAIAYASLRWYDVPVRKWLMKRFMKA
jgi:peptidoglycan/LPS O-acetylase OafA/YrhL